MKFLRQGSEISPLPDQPAIERSLGNGPASSVLLRKAYFERQK